MDGAKVVINYVNDAKAANEVVCKIAENSKGSAISIQADISTPVGRQFLIDETVAKWHKIDIL